MTVEEEWKNEPDFEEFEDYGYVCVLKRNSTLKHWTGYVKIPKGHPWFGTHSAELNYVEVHGLIQYGDFNPFDEDDTEFWWVGFNCFQPFDLIPYYYESEEGQKWPGLFKNHTYRNIEFVRKQCKIIAKAAAFADDWAKRERK